LAVVKSQTDDNADASALSSFGELMESLDIVPGMSQMTEGTCRPGSSHIRLGFGKPRWDTNLADLEHAAEHDSLPIPNGKPVEPVSFYPCILPPQQITMLKLDSDEEIVTLPGSSE